MTKFDTTTQNGSNLVELAVGNKWFDLRFSVVKSTGLRALHVEASAGVIIRTADRTVLQRRRHDRLVCRIQRTLPWTFLYHPRLSEWHYLSRVFSRHNDHHPRHQKCHRQHAIHLCTVGKGNQKSLLVVLLSLLWLYSTKATAELRRFAMVQRVGVVLPMATCQPQQPTRRCQVSLLSRSLVRR